MLPVYHPPTPNPNPYPGTLLHLRNTTRVAVVARILSDEQAERLKEDGRDASVIAPELTVEAGDTLHVPLPLAHLSHFAFRPMAPSGWDGSRDDGARLSWCPPISIVEVMRGESFVECSPRATSDAQPWEAREVGRDPWCCTISLDLEPIGGADDADDHGSRTTRQHQDDRDLDLDLDGRTTRRGL